MNKYHEYIKNNNIKLIQKKDIKMVIIATTTTTTTTTNNNNNNTITASTRPKSIYGVTNSNNNNHTRVKSPSQSAPLWRNAPTINYRLSMFTSPIPSTTPPKKSLSTSLSSSNGVILPRAISFQQSLRSYPTTTTTTIMNRYNDQRSSIATCATTNQSVIKQAIFEQQQQKKESSLVDQNLTNSSITRCDKSQQSNNNNNEQYQYHNVTSLESEQSTPFFLDYLDSQSFTQDPSKPSFNTHNYHSTIPETGIGMFNHHKFMEMFREPREIIDDSSAQTSTQDFGESGSLPYTVNEQQQQQEVHKIDNDGRSSEASRMDSLISQTNDDKFFYFSGSGDEIVYQPIVSSSSLFNKRKDNQTTTGSKGIKGKNIYKQKY